MESCKTPSNFEAIEFQFDHVSTPKIPTEYIQKVQNLVVKSGDKRCFTPTTSEICSPGLSPIFNMEESIVLGATVKMEPKDQFNFPMPIANNKLYKKVNSNSNPTTKFQQTPIQQQQQQQQQQLKQQISESQNYFENTSFELDLSTSSKLENSLDMSTRSDISKTSCILNQTLNVTVLLKAIGLGQYSEKFAKEGIDLEKFLKIKPNELKGLGLQSDEDCKAIIDMLGDLNSSQTLKI